MDISGLSELAMSVDIPGVEIGELGGEFSVVKADENVNVVARGVVEDAGSTSLLIEAGVVEGPESVVVKVSLFTVLKVVVDSVVVAAGTQA